MSAGSRRRRPAWLIGGVAVAIAVMVFVLAPNASSSPDGLEKVAADTGVDAEVHDHAFADGPLADYAVSGVDDATLSTGVAGTIGVVVTLIVTVAIGRVVARRRGPPAADTP